MLSFMDDDTLKVRKVSDNAFRFEFMIKHPEMHFDVIVSGVYYLPTNEIVFDHSVYQSGDIEITVLSTMPKRVNESVVSTFSSALKNAENGQFTHHREMMSRLKNKVLERTGIDNFS